MEAGDVAIRAAMFQTARAEMKLGGIPADLEPHLIEDAEIDLVDGKGLQIDLLYNSGIRRTIWTDAKGAMEFRIAVDLCERAGMQDLRLR